MNTRNDLIIKINSLIENNNSSVSAILSTSYTKNDSFREAVGAHIETNNRHSLVLPSFSVRDFFNEKQVFEKVVIFLRQSGFLKNESYDENCLNAVSKSLFWKQLKPAIDLNHVQSIIFIITDLTISNLSIHEIYDIHSNLRKFCTEWKDSDLSVHFITYGDWEPSKLERFFLTCQTSWPFVNEYNLFVLPDLTVEEVYGHLRDENIPGMLKMLHARFLWELSLGDPWCVEQIIEKMGGYSCDDIFTSATSVIDSGEMTAILGEKISSLSQIGKQTLEQLLIGVSIKTNGHYEVANELILGGLCRQEYLNELAIVKMKNWIIESAIRSRKELHVLAGFQKIYSDYRQLVPPIKCINLEAYSYLCEIENFLRNQVMLRLFANQSEEVTNPLVGITTSNSVSYDDVITDDMFMRATKWYNKRVLNSKSVDTHSALICFSRLPNLIEITDQLIFRKKDPLFDKLRPYRQDLVALKDIRDAIAHNQLISEESYDLIVKVRDQLIRIFCSS